MQVETGNAALGTCTLRSPGTGALVDATAITATLQAPDLTTSSPTVTHVGLGVYTATPAITLPGVYVLRFTGNVAGAAFLVEQPFLANPTLF